MKIYILVGFIKKSLTGLFTILTIISFQQPIVFSQEINKITKTKHPEQLEYLEDGRISANNKRTSEAYFYKSERFFATQVNVNSSGQNIFGDAANEPSIAVDPSNSDRMAIGWRHFLSVTSNYRQAGIGYSTDGGETWTFGGVLDDGEFRSDPVLDSDSKGNFYYNSLSVSPYTCTVYKSTNGGISWDDGTFAYGGDKQWMTIDKTVGVGKGNFYAYWSYEYSLSEDGFFTRSANNGNSFEQCIIIPGRPYWGTLAVGPDGEIYVCGAGENGFVVAKSDNAKYSSQEVVWNMSKAVSLNGEIAVAISESPNPAGLLGQAWITVDNSNSRFRGNVYLLCSVKPNTKDDPLDVMFARSTDGGNSWSYPTRINDDAGSLAWQWFGTMSVAPNGRLDVVWLDTRDDPGGYYSALYYSFSVDGGVSWSANEKLSDSFNPHLGWPRQNKLGDYFDMVSENDKVHVAWAGTFNGEQDVYYGRISPGITAISEDEERVSYEYSLLTNYPNPFNGNTIIKYVLPEKSKIKLELFNVLGQIIEVLVEREDGPGYNTYSLSSENLESGVYFYRLTTDDKSIMKKLIVLK